MLFGQVVVHLLSVAARVSYLQVMFIGNACFRVLLVPISGTVSVLIYLAYCHCFEMVAWFVVFVAFLCSRI